MSNKVIIMSSGIKIHLKSNVVYIAYKNIIQLELLQDNVLKISYYTSNKNEKVITYQFEKAYELNNTTEKIKWNLLMQKNYSAYTNS